MFYLLLLLLSQSDLWHSCKSENAPHPLMVFISTHFLNMCPFVLCRDLLPGQRAVAMISEMIHTASLVHDDVIDGSDKRRGKRTINEMWGEKKVRAIISSQTAQFLLFCCTTSSLVFIFFKDMNIICFTSRPSWLEISSSQLPPWCWLVLVTTRW